MALIIGYKKRGELMTVKKTNKKKKPTNQFDREVTGKKIAFSTGFAADLEKRFSTKTKKKKTKKK